MTIRRNSPIIFILAGVVVLAAGGLAYQHSEIRSLRTQLEEHQAALESTSRTVAAATSRLETQESRIDALEHMTRRGAEKTDLPSIEKLEALEPGYYQLTTTTSYKADVEEMPPYTITHIVLELDRQTWGTKLNIGLARSGMVPSGVYFDYDNDAAVDIDMGLNFIRDIPVFGRSLADTYDPVVSQDLYTIFVNESDHAEFTSIEDLRNDAEAASSYLWRFVDSRYRVMEARILENLPEQQEQP